MIEMTPPEIKGGLDKYRLFNSKLTNNEFERKRQLVSQIVLAFDDAKNHRINPWNGEEVKQNIYLDDSSDEEKEKLDCPRQITKQHCLRPHQLGDDSLADYDSQSDSSSQSSTKFRIIDKYESNGLLQETIKIENQQFKIGESRNGKLKSDLLWQFSNIYSPFFDFIIYFSSSKADIFTLKRLISETKTRSINPIFKQLILFELLNLISNKEKEVKFITPIYSEPKKQLKLGRNKTFVTSAATRPKSSIASPTSAYALKINTEQNSTPCFHRRQKSSQINANQIIASHIQNHLHRKPSQLLTRQNTSLTNLLQRKESVPKMINIKPTKFMREQQISINKQPVYRSQSTLRSQIMSTKSQVVFEYFASKAQDDDEIEPSAF